MTRSRWVLASAAVLVAGMAIGAAAATSSTTSSTPDATAAAPDTREVERGTLSAMVSLRGTLTYRAAADGSPYVVINRAGGTYTSLPGAGDEVACGGELHRVDDRPVLLLCGSLPAYRDLRLGDGGPDVRQLNANLHDLGYDVAAGVVIDAGDGAFTEATAQALALLQRDRGAEATGELHLDGAAFLPEPVRIATVAAELGAPAQPGAPVVEATSDVLEVQVALSGSEQGAVTAGNPARIILPSNASVTGSVERVGTVAQAPAGPGGGSAPATTSASIALDDPAALHGLDQAPVRVEVTTHGVDDVLSVPVAAIVGRSGGGFAVEVVRDDDRRELVAVALGLFDATAGRVEVDGDLRDGDAVVVPAS